MRHISLLAALLVLAACTEITAETTPKSGGTLAAPVRNPATIELEAAADEICSEHAWRGIREPASFVEEATGLQTSPEVVASAVRRSCPEAFYESLSKAETDWCGDGLSFENNFFLVVAAGVDLGIESFTIVDPGLLSRASTRRAELTDYEIELLTAGLQTMTESSRFERDWAEACRSTF